MARKHVNNEGNILDCSTTPENCDFNDNAGHLEPGAAPEEISNFYRQAEKVAQKAAGKTSAVGSSKTKAKSKLKVAKKESSPVDETFDLADSIQKDIYPEEHPDSEDVDLYPVKVSSMNVTGGELRTIHFYDGTGVSIEKSDKYPQGYYYHRKESLRNSHSGILKGEEAENLQKTIREKAYESRGQAEYDDSAVRITTMARKVDPNFTVVRDYDQIDAKNGGKDRSISVYGENGGFTFIQKAHKDLEGNDRYFYGVVDNDTDDDPAYMKSDTRTSMEHMAARYMFALKSKNDSNDRTSSIHEYDGLYNRDKANTLFSEFKGDK